ncbi:hypothetical protein Enr10x_57050 [Gimesia panareensis]|uniref:Uncharacterized protein n=1 Tax=Gimesia panareensis TaxID=2527978 RepID=A0A517QFB1_9PLAN|nr:hypothetical protein [Gimesia panareensis]QDT30339.1 hypothetical protein Enr10x_57050 [Gimesia panareensis]
MNQESRLRRTKTSKLVTALVTIIVLGMLSIFEKLAHADQPLSATKASAGDLFETEGPTAAQIARQKLIASAKAAPDKLQAIGLFCHNPMGWKMLVYLPPGKAWRLYGAIRPIPFPVLVKPAPEDDHSDIPAAPRGRIVQLEGSLSINDEGHWQLIIETDRPVIQGTDLAVFSFYRPGDETREAIARYITRQEPQQSCITGSVGTQHVTRKQNDKLELLSARYVPQSFAGKKTAETLFPGYSVWIEATPRAGGQNGK